MHNDLALVKLLIESGADCCAPHASGDFFYDHRALYFGGSCLGFAACMGRKDIVAYLLTNSHCQANPNQLDLGPHCANRTFNRSMARENTVLHCLVLHDQQEMYRTLVDEYGANPWAPNIHGDTPLLLACRRSLNMAQVAMIASRQMVWSYASVTCVRYPLYELEGEGFGARRKRQGGAPSTGSERLSEGSGVMKEVSQLLRGRQGQRHMNVNANRQSVLSVVTRERVASLLYSDVLWKLIQDKWHVFGRPRFFWFAAVSLICQMLLTLSLCRRPVLEDAPWLLQPGDKCEGVLVVLIVPISLQIPTRVASWCFSASLALNAILLLRLLFAMSRLGTNTRSGLSRQVLGLLAHVMPWVALLVLKLGDEGLYFVVHGFAASLGWLHFMKVCFSFQARARAHLFYLPTPLLLHPSTHPFSTGDPWSNGAARPRDGARRPHGLPPHLLWVCPRLRRRLLRSARGHRDGCAARLRHVLTPAPLHGQPRHPHHGRPHPPTRGRDRLPVRHEHERLSLGLRARAAHVLPDLRVPVGVDVQRRAAQPTHRHDVQQAWP